MSVWIFDMLVDYVNRTGQLTIKEKQTVNEIVSNAVRFTRTHIARTRENKADIPSMILSTTWQDAANKLQRLGHDENLKSFARMLEEKSKYWSDPKGYKPVELDKYDIRLTQVEETLKQMIK